MAGSEATLQAQQQERSEQLRELRELYPAIRRFAAVVGRFDVDPDDLVQDAYTRILARPSGEIRELGPYLRRTVVNLATTERRRARRRVELVRRLDDGHAAVDAYPSELADLLRLDQHVRGLLYLVEVEHERIADAAEVVGMSAAAARMALTRARRRLRAELDRERNGD